MNTDTVLERMSKEEIIVKIKKRKDLFCKTCGNIKVKNDNGIDFCDKCNKFICFRCGAHLKKNGKCLECHVVFAEKSLTPIALSVPSAATLLSKIKNKIRRSNEYRHQQRRDFKRLEA